MSVIHIIGCGGHARSVADILVSSQPKTTLIFIDPGAREKEKIWGFKVLKHLPLKAKDKIFLGIGDNKLRHLKAEELKNQKLISIVSKKAHIGKNASLGAGCFIGNFSHIGPDTILGKNAIINNGAIVEHEVTIGDYCHIAPNVAISGRSTLGDFVFVGVGATIINNITICSDVIIGAGATVVKDITEPGIYVGTPARKIKS